MQLEVFIQYRIPTPNMVLSVSSLDKKCVGARRGARKVSLEEKYPPASPPRNLGLIYPHTLTQTSILQCNAMVFFYPLVYVFPFPQFGFPAMLKINRNWKSLSIQLLFPDISCLSGQLQISFSIQSIVCSFFSSHHCIRHVECWDPGIQDPFFLTPPPLSANMT